MSASTTRRLRFAAALLSTIACLAGFSPPAQAVRLTGSVNITSTDGGSGQVWFNCDGENPCRGTYIAVLRTGTCSDEFGRVDDITITGLNLSRPGPISGSVTLTDIDNQNVLRNPDGSFARNAAGQRIRRPDAGAAWRPDACAHRRRPAGGWGAALGDGDRRAAAAGVGRR